MDCMYFVLMYENNGNLCQWIQSIHISIASQILLEFILPGFSDKKRKKTTEITVIAVKSAYFPFAIPYTIDLYVQWEKERKTQKKKFQWVHKIVKWTPEYDGKFVNDQQHGRRKSIMFAYFVFFSTQLKVLNWKRLKNTSV